MNVPNLTEQQKDRILKAIFKLPSRLQRFCDKFPEALDEDTYIEALCDTSYSANILHDYRNGHGELTPEQINRCLSSLPVTEIYLVLPSDKFTEEQKSKVIERALKYKAGVRSLYHELGYLSHDFIRRLAKKMFSYTFNDTEYRAMYKCLLEYAKGHNIQL